MGTHTLRVSSNQLSGTMPTALSKLTALEAVHLGINRLSGSVPSELSTIEALKHISLHFNELERVIARAILYRDHQCRGAIPRHAGKEWYKNK